MNPAPQRPHGGPERAGTKIKPIDLGIRSRAALNRWNRLVSKNHIFARTHQLDISFSYKRMIEYALFRDMKVMPTPEPDKPRHLWHRRVRVLEIGYGGGQGFEHLTDDRPRPNIWKRKIQAGPHIPQGDVVGIELLPELKKQAKKRFPGIHYYQMDGDPDALPSALESWAEKGVLFHLILARHVMHLQPNADRVLRSIASVLMPSPVNERPRGVFVMAVPVPAEIHSREPEEMVHLGLEWGQMEKKRSFKEGGVLYEIPVYGGKWVPGGWPEKLETCGLGVHSGNRWRLPSLLAASENILFCHRR